jgi:hypothetical protein
MATVGFINGAKKTLRKVVKAVDVRTSRYNANLGKTNANFDKSVKRAPVNDFAYVNSKGNTVVEPSKRRAQLEGRKKKIETMREQKRKGIQKKQMAVGLGGGLALGGVAAIAKKRQEAQNRPMARIRNNFR